MEESRGIMRCRFTVDGRKGNTVVVWCWILMKHDLVGSLLGLRPVAIIPSNIILDHHSSFENR